MFSAFRNRIIFILFIGTFLAACNADNKSELKKINSEATKTETIVDAGNKKQEKGYQYWYCSHLKNQECIERQRQNIHPWEKWSFESWLVA